MNPKGSVTKVEPIRDLEAINRIKAMLEYKPREFALFTLGINTNLRACDLLNLRVGQVRYLKPMGELILKEKKTKKIRRINMNAACIEAIQRLLAAENKGDTEFLFTGQRGRMSTATVGKWVKDWCACVGLRGGYSSHSLRKSWSWHQYRTFGAALPDIMVALNHSSQAVTLGYLCIQPKELERIYANVI